MGRVEHREARAYVAVRLVVTVDQLGHRAGEAFDGVAQALARHGIAPRGGIVRYRAARPGATFEIEVGHLVEAEEAAAGPIVPDVLPAGDYSIAHHDGPYADLGPVTKELMDSWEPDGVRPAMAHTPVGDHYASWYELYLDMPREGPRGPEGAVEIAVLVDGHPEKGELP